MAHTAGPEEKAEPNLVPLLDLVLQLIMFFLIPEKASAGQNVPPSVHLPVAETAAALKPLEPGVLGVYLHLTKEGNIMWKDVGVLSVNHVLLYPDSKKFAELDRKNRIYYCYKALFDRIYKLRTDTIREAKKEAAKFGRKYVEPKFVVILRADAQSQMSDLILLQKWCKENELGHVRIHVKKEGPAKPA